MGLFGKNKGEKNSSDGVTLPDLPEANNLDLPSVNDLDAPNFPDLEVNELPALPESNTGQNHEAIKSAVNAPIKKPLADSPPVPMPQKSKFQLVEEPHGGAPVKIGHGGTAQPVPVPESGYSPEPVYSPEPIAPEPAPAHQPIMRKSISTTKPKSNDQESIYVRLDKFQTTVGAFEEIKEKVMEIEKLLLNIKEVKEKEERELGEWENEIQVIKSRIELIDRDIFNKLD
jgi:hypothetical protein